MEAALQSSFSPRIFLDWWKSWKGVKQLSLRRILSPVQERGDPCLGIKYANRLYPKSVKKIGEEIKEADGDAARQEQSSPPSQPP